MKLLARIAMALSVTILAGTLCYFWAQPLLGENQRFWQSVGLPDRADPLPPGILVAGWVTSANAVLGLVLCYLAVNNVLGAPRDLIFGHLAVALRKLSGRLIYFWISYGIATGLMPELAVASVLGTAGSEAVHNWNPMGINSVLLVLGLAFRPIASAMRAADNVAAENQSFV